METLNFIAMAIGYAVIFAITFDGVASLYRRYRP